MAEIMVIRALFNAGEYEQLSHENTQTLRFKSDMLAELNGLPGADNLTLLISPSQILFRKLILPNAGYKITNQSIAWLAEESMIADSESLHWTVLAHSKEAVHVAGINVAELEKIMSPLTAAGLQITSVLPDGLHLPYEENCWSAEKDNEGWLVRFNEYQLSHIDEAWFIHLINEHAPETIITSELLPTAFDSIKSIDGQHRYDIATMSNINLLSGALKPKPPARRVSKKLSLILWSALGLALLCFFSLKALTIGQLSNQADEINAQIQTTWQQYFPNDKHNNNYKFYLNQKIKDSYPDAMTQLSHLHAAIKLSPGIRIVSMDYNLRKRSFDLEVQADSLSALDVLMRNSEADFMFTQRTDDTAPGVYHLRSEKHD